MKSFSSPARAFLYRPLTSRSSADLERRGHVDQHVAVGPDAVLCLLPHRLVRRNGGDQSDDARLGEQPRHLGEPPQVLLAVLFGEAEVARDPGAHHVAVEQEAALARDVQPAIERPRHRGLARARQTREPKDAPAMPRQILALRGGQRGSASITRTHGGTLRSPARRCKRRLDPFAGLVTRLLDEVVARQLDAQRLSELGEVGVEAADLGGTDPRRRARAGRASSTAA